MLDFARADAECQRSERAMRAGMAVAAHDRAARQRQSELGTDDVHDALAAAVEVEERHAEFDDVAPEGVDLLARQRIGDGEMPLADVGTL